jgi:hypothetical protein
MHCITLRVDQIKLSLHLCLYSLFFFNFKPTGAVVQRLFFFSFFNFLHFLYASPLLQIGPTWIICGAFHFFFLIELHLFTWASKLRVTQFTAKTRREVFLWAMLSFWLAFLQFCLFLFHPHSTMHLSFQLHFFSLFCWPFPFPLPCIIFLFVCILQKYNSLY